jgi:hypothetical protein
MISLRFVNKTFPNAGARCSTTFTFPCMVWRLNKPGWEPRTYPRVRYSYTYRGARARICFVSRIHMHRNFERC